MANEKLFDQLDKTLATLDLFCKVLPILNRYILFFQKRESLMHQLHAKPEELLKEFLGCFLKPSMLLDAGPTRLLKLKNQLDSSEVPQSETDVFIGNAADKLF